MPTWLTIILALGGSAAISAFVGAIIKRSLDKSFKDRDELEELRAEKQRKERKADVVETIQAELQPLHEKIDKLSTAVDYGMEGTVTLMRETLKELRDKYKTQGYSDAGDKATWNELCAKYRALGGNSWKEFVSVWAEEVNSLPNEPVIKK